MEKRRNVIWDEQALVEFVKSLKWIGENSTQQAEKVELEILDRIEIIRLHPERYPPDKYKTENLGNYRALELLNYRISYHHTDNEVKILRFRHVKQNPKNY